MWIEIYETPQTLCHKLVMIYLIWKLRNGTYINTNEMRFQNILKKKTFE